MTLPPAETPRLPSMAESLLPIAMFSRASLLSIKALCAYHEAGILVPARVDPHTGYRAYRPTQLTDAAVCLDFAPWIFGWPTSGRFCGPEIRT